MTVHVVTVTMIVTVTMMGSGDGDSDKLWTHWTMMGSYSGNKNNDKGTTIMMREARIR
jgi:hypothetical protein